MKMTVTVNELDDEALSTIKEQVRGIVQDVIREEIENAKRPGGLQSRDGRG